MENLTENRVDVSMVSGHRTKDAEFVSKCLFLRSTVRAIAVGFVVNIGIIMVRPFSVNLINDVDRV